MDLFLQRLLDLYNQASSGIDGIKAIKAAIEIENKFRLNNDKLSLKMVVILCCPSIISKVFPSSYKTKLPKK